MDREIWKIVNKMAASGRKEVASDVKFGMEASFVEIYLRRKYGDPTSNGIQSLSVSPRRNIFH